MITLKYLICWIDCIAEQQIKCLLLSSASITCLTCHKYNGPITRPKMFCNEIWISHWEMTNQHAVKIECMRRTLNLPNVHSLFSSDETRYHHLIYTRHVSARGCLAPKILGNSPSKDHKYPNHTVFRVRPNKIWRWVSVFFCVPHQGYILPWTQDMFDIIRHCHTALSIAK